MTNEWTVVEKYGANNDGQIVRYAIANNASVSKYAMLQLLDARTVSSGCLAAQHFRIANEEHIANQGITSIGCITQGRMRFKASLAVTVGDEISPGGMNTACSQAITGTLYTGVFSEDTLADAETGTARINQ